MALAVLAAAGAFALIVVRWSENEIGRYNSKMPSYAFDIDPHRLTLTVRDSCLFDIAEKVAMSLGIGETSRSVGCLSIRCTNIDDLVLLGQVLADRAS